MRCVTGNTAQFLCINKQCEMKNPYICANPEDGCKTNHQPCSLISLSYLLKKTRSETSSKNKDNKFSKLIPMYDKAKHIASTISQALVAANCVKDINMMLEDGGPLSPEDKQKITRFMSDRSLNSAEDNINFQLEKELDQFIALVSDFQSSLKFSRNKEIQELKKRLQREEKLRSEEQMMPVQSKMFQRSDLNIKLKPMMAQSGQESFQMGQPSPVKSKAFGPSEGPSPVKSKVESKVSEKKPKSKSKGFGFEQKLQVGLKNHIPKGPLFSKITNDITTINTFFNEKFEKAHLLYRASQHNFNVSKFHEKCDGKKFTLTLVLTEFDKVIGGFTPLPWKSGGGDWYQDPQCQSFLFNLSSGQKYPLQEKQKAIWCSRTYGPSFGHPDLQISDKAFHNSNSCANFPTCYNNGNYVNSAGSTQLFCGTKNGHFRIKQWEVYELTFP